MTRTPDANWRLSSEDIEALKRLDKMPDSEIRTDLVPEASPEAQKKVRKNPWAKLLIEQTQRKAS